MPLDNNLQRLTKRQHDGLNVTEKENFYGYLIERGVAHLNRKFLETKEYTLSINSDIDSIIHTSLKNVIQDKKLKNESFAKSFFKLITEKAELLVMTKLSSHFTRLTKDDYSKLSLFEKGTFEKYLLKKGKEKLEKRGANVEQTKDVLQEARLKFIQSLGKINKSIANWFSRVVYNKFTEYLKEENHYKKAEEFTVLKYDSTKVSVIIFLKSFRKYPSKKKFGVIKKNDAVYILFFEESGRLWRKKLKGEMSKKFLDDLDNNVKLREYISAEFNLGETQVAQMSYLEGDQEEDVAGEDASHSYSSVMYSNCRSTGTMRIIKDEIRKEWVGYILGIKIDEYIEIICEGYLFHLSDDLFLATIFSISKLGSNRKKYAYIYENYIKEEVTLNDYMHTLGIPEKGKITDYWIAEAEKEFKNTFKSYICEDGIFKENKSLVKLMLDEPNNGILFFNKIYGKMFEYKYNVFYFIISSIIGLEINSDPIAGKEKKYAFIYKHLLEQGTDADEYADYFGIERNFQTQLSAAEKDFQEQYNVFQKQEEDYEKRKK